MTGLKSPPGIAVPLASSVPGALLWVGKPVVGLIGDVALISLKIIGTKPNSPFGPMLFSMIAISFTVTPTETCIGYSTTNGPPVHEPAPNWPSIMEAPWNHGCKYWNDPLPVLDPTNPTCVGLPPF